ASGEHVLLGESLTLTEIRTSRPHKGRMLVLFEHVADRTAAEALRGQWLYIPDEAAMELDEDAFWVHDIIGLAVVDEEGRGLGVVQDVLETGANDVYIVRTPPDVNRGRDLLLPAIADVIRVVDLETRRLIVRLTPGLLEE
ncbi:MAG: 16S rRNA processing protein RimM, partial [Caldilineae bacterium]